jgi:hypothetical protein
MEAILSLVLGAGIGDPLARPGSVSAIVVTTTNKPIKLVQEQPF